MLRKVTKTGGDVTDTLEKAFLAFSDEFDRFITIVRTYDVFSESYGEPEIFDQFREAATSATASVIALSVAGTAAKFAQADDRSELSSSFYLLYRIQRELDKMVQCVRAQYNAITNEEIKQTYQQFFDELGFTKEIDADIANDPESEFYDLQDYIHLFNPAVSSVRRLGRRLLDAMGWGKRRGNKSYKELEANHERYTRYIQHTHESFEKEEGVDSSEANIGLTHVIAKDVELDTDIPDVKLNDWEKWFSILFLVNETQYEKDPGFLDPTHRWGDPTPYRLAKFARFCGKVKNTVSNAWDGLGNYAVFYWVVWASVWTIGGTAVLAGTLATGLTLGIPAIPAFIYFARNLLKSKEDKAAEAAAKAQAAKNDLFFAKAYIQSLRHSYERIYHAQSEHIQKMLLDRKIGNQSKGKDKIDAEESNLSIELTPEMLKKLNKKHATFKQVWKHIKSLNLISALTLTARLGWAKVWGKKPEDIAYVSPTEAILARLDSKYAKHQNMALNIFSGFFNGGVMTAFASWPVTSILVFAGVSAAGGPLAQLVCYGIAALVGTFSAVKQATTASIEAKRQRAIIEKYRPAVNQLIAAEKKAEYLRMQLKEGYQQIIAASNNQRDAQLFKPVLPIKDLATNDRFHRRKSTEKSTWTPVKKFMNRAYHTIGSVETGMLVARFIFFAGGVVSLLGQLGFVGSMGTSIPIAIMVSAGLMYGGIKLHEYCVNKQRERDMTVVKNAHARLQVVEEENMFLQQQLNDQQAHLAILKTQAPVAAQRVPADMGSVAVINSALNGQLAEPEKREASSSAPSSSVPFTPKKRPLSWNNSPINAGSISTNTINTDQSPIQPAVQSN